MTPFLVTLGIGCDRGTAQATIQEAVDLALAQAGVLAGQVKAVASITLKADEQGLLDLAAAHGWPLQFFPPEALAAVPVPNPSETVRRHTGTPSVSEAAALLAAGPHTPMTALVLEKLRHRGNDGRHATVSIARKTP
ncbi:cobalamin biosynthesis protein [Roseateles sp. SL47]|jgi:cobalt-precorrin 5A hydrolase|uniref:cobalamin biosynthesis protein n=1 Tax=Roseateles sp. SL47 TaxID=2995138 RepID=UPI0022703CF5|nr:cobalamin biosynthesis protein [Roseateles sp. SL47]WAC73485.1 cobalamin biosynthesis protein [Roseateles sp. SL47]